MSDVLAAPSAAPAPAQAEGGLARLAGVFIAPARTFASIARRPTCLLPFALAAGLAVPITELYMAKADLRTDISKAFEKKGVKATDEQIDQAVERTRRIAPLFDVISLVALSAVMFGTAAVLWISCQAFGWEVKYKQSLGITTHAFLPSTVASGVLLALLWNRDVIDKATMGDALPTNLGRLADAHTDPVGHSLLSSVNVISFWMMALLVLGLSAASGASRKRTAILVVSLWLLLVLGKAGVAALFP